MREGRMHAAATLGALALAVGLLALVIVIALSGGLPMTVETPPTSLDDPLGAVLLDLDTPEAISTYHVSRAGTYVLAVGADTPAQAAGLRSGDCIMAVDGQSVGSSTELLGLLKTGGEYTLGILRADEQATVTLSLAAQ